MRRDAQQAAFGSEVHAEVQHSSLHSSADDSFHLPSIFSRSRKSLLPMNAMLIGVIRSATTERTPRLLTSICGASDCAPTFGLTFPTQSSERPRNRAKIRLRPVLIFPPN